MTTDFETRIPRYLSSQPQILWWEIDEVMVLTAATGVGILFEILLITVPLGLVAAKLMAKVKTEHGHGWLLHQAWWRGIPLTRLVIPHTHREFWG